MLEVGKKWNYIFGDEGMNPYPPYRASMCLEDTVRIDGMLYYTVRFVSEEKELYDDGITDTYLREDVNERKVWARSSGGSLLVPFIYPFYGEILLYDFSENTFADCGGRWIYSNPGNNFTFENSGYSYNAFKLDEAYPRYYAVEGLGIVDTQFDPHRSSFKFLFGSILETTGTSHRYIPYHLHTVVASDGTVMYENEPVTLIEDNEEPRIDIQSDGQSIHISGTAYVPVTRADGVTIWQGNADGSTTIPVSAPGIYVVTANSQVKKVVVK